MPTKTIVERKSVSLRSISTYDYLTAAQPEPSTYTVSASATSTKTGSANPGWRSAVRLGQSATTPYSADIRTNELSKGSWSETLYQNGDPRKWKVASGDFLPGIYTPGALPSVSRIQSDAVLKASNKIRGALMKMSGPTFLGELRDTVHMIKHPAQSLLRSMELYCKAARNMRSVKALTDSYLEYTYGWGPLMSDIRGAANVAASMMINDQPSVVSSMASEKSNPEIYMQDKQLWTNVYVKQTRTYTTEVSCRIKAGIRSEVYGPIGSLQRLAQLSGFSWTEFVPTAYELLPFSFVLDYFSNVGSVLSAGYASKGYTSWVSVSTRTEASVKVVEVPKFQNFSGYTRPIEIGSPGMTESKRIIVTRSASMPDVEVSFDLPSKKQVLNLAILVKALTS
jgi:hypothetical protein